MGNDWQLGDVVQIDPEHDGTFGGSFMIVTELKSWGAQGYVQIPGKAGVAYYRVPFGKAEKVGAARWVLDHEEATG